MRTDGRAWFFDRLPHFLTTNGFAGFIFSSEADHARIADHFEFRQCKRGKKEALQKLTGGIANSAASGSER